MAGRIPGALARAGREMRHWGRNLLLALGGALAFFFLTVFVEERHVFLAPLAPAKPSSGPEGDEGAMVEVVRAYNARVAEAYARHDASVVRPSIEGDELADLVAADLKFLAARGRNLRLELVGLEVKALRRLGPTRASLTAIEEWIHEYRDAGSGSMLSPPQRSRERLSYHLAKIEGRWRVAAVSASLRAEGARP